MLKADVAVKRRGERALGLDLGLGVQDVAHALDGHAGLAHLRENAAQAAHGPDQRLVVADKGQEHAQGDLAGDGHVRARAHDGDDLDAGDQVADAPVVGQQAAQVDPQRGEALVALVEALDLEALAAEGAHDAHAGQVLLHGAGQFALGLVGGAEAAGDARVEDHRIAGHDGQKDQRDEGELGVHGEHQPQVERDHEHRAHDLGQLIDDEGAHDLHIGRAALDDLARLMAYMPRKGQALDVRKERVAHGLDEALGGAGEGHAPGVVAQGVAQGQKRQRGGGGQ